MSRVAPALLALALVFAPAVALACPGSAGAGKSSCGSCGGSGTAPGLGVGMIIGIGSIALENVLRKRR
ncbi:hypothetical protein BH09MYX1_BH09MYX1_20640 [soil metagenome]